MKPIIVNMKDMSDSVEVYESRPNPFFKIFIYFVLGILVLALGWMYFFDIDIVIKGRGTFQLKDSSSVVTNQIDGTIITCPVEDGMYVREGDLLFKVDSSNFEKDYMYYKSELNVVEEKLSITKAYLKALNGDESDFQALKDNSYYTEYQERWQLVHENVNIDKKIISSQIKQYDQLIENAKNSITHYDKQVDNLIQIQNCIKKRQNTFPTSNMYAYTLIQNYFRQYNVLKENYITQIEQLRNDKENVDDSLQIEYKKKIKSLETEKEQSLSNLELEQIASLEQQLQTVENTLYSLQSELKVKQVERDSLKNGTAELSFCVKVLEEKKLVYMEIQSYNGKANDYKQTIESLEKKIKQSHVTASETGYINLTGSLCTGSYVAAGTNVCTILPQKANSYEVQLYIFNEDVGQLKEGQKVNFDIAAYASSEYGQISGEIIDISKDTKVDAVSNSAYYLVRVELSDVIPCNKSGEVINIRQGMACEGKVVVDKKRMLTYLLEKIDLLD